MNMPKAVVIGATSGIGKELAKVLSQNGFTLGITGRRSDLLFELKEELRTETYIKRIDISQPDNAMKLLAELITEMAGVDVIIISSGVCFDNQELDWNKEKATLDVNVSGFAAMANVAFNYFCKQGTGHIVGISSIRSHRGGWSAPAYNASKAFISNYLEGLRIKSNKMSINIHITDIKPGFVNTPMIKNRKNRFLVISVEKAANQIFNAIKNKKKSAYVTKQWALIAFLLKIMPYKIYKKL
jgi:short-subunit dehydrogenase